MKTVISFFCPAASPPVNLTKLRALTKDKVRGLTVEAKAAKPSRSKLDPELAFWQAIKDSQNAGDYAAFLKAYPDGALAPLAKSRYQALRDRAASPPSAPARNRAPGVVLVKVEPMDGDYVAVTKSLVRSEPGSQHGTTATLKSGDRISVTGKVPNRNWLQVSRGGQIIGYVYGVSLRPFALVEQGNVQAARRQNLQSAALAADRKRKRNRTSHTNGIWMRRHASNGNRDSGVRGANFVQNFCIREKTCVFRNRNLNNLGGSNDLAQSDQVGMGSGHLDFVHIDDAGSCMGAGWTGGRSKRYAGPK
ncbi:MAG: SH3 domain-containing protein [Alphaproteobacteria bacterium]